MNWEAAGAIGEIVGAAAVVLTLLYLAVQIRSSRRADKALVREAITSNFINLIRVDFDDADTAELFVKFEKGEPLTDVDKHRLRKSAVLFLRYYENIHYQYRNGLFDKSEWQTYRRALMNFFSEETPRPGSIAWVYDLQPDAYSDEFQALIIRLREQIVPIRDRFERKDPYDWGDGV